MVTSSPASTAAGQDSDVASHTSGDGVAVVETADISSDRGGSSRVETRERALPGMADLEDGPTDAPDMGSADPVQELREALGWGGIDREALAPRPEWAGTLEGRGARHTSPQTALDDVDISWRTAVNAQGTAVGRYIAQVEDIVGARWQNKDIGTFSRARGIQGQVTVQYRIQPNGRVTDIRLARSSGHTLLDQIALQAIPRKLPRFPSGLGREDIPHRIVLRYRNPLVGPSVFLP
jgi:TonB family protein